MPFDSIKDAGTHADLLAFFRLTTKPGATSERTAQTQMKAMMGGSGRGPNLKVWSLPDRSNHCRDTYPATADGRTRAFWARNLRFMTGTSKDGPEEDAPAIMPAGMMGDCVAAIFAEPGRTSLSSSIARG